MEMSLNKRRNNVLGMAGEVFKDQLDVSTQFVTSDAHSCIASIVSAFPGIKGKCFVR